MNLYIVHDDPEEMCSFEDGVCWELVWANTKEEAEEVYRIYSESGIPEEEPLYIEEQTEPRAEPDKPEPHCENRLEVLRLYHWRQEGESSCDTCGLYPLGMEEYDVCPDCNQCKECGCYCEEEEGNG